jgi:hypothetical protein
MKGARQLMRRIGIDGQLPAAQVNTQVVYQKLSVGKTGKPLDTAFVPRAASPRRTRLG